MDTDIAVTLRALEKASSTEWPAPASEPELDALESTYGPLPADVRTMYEYSRAPVFGIFDEVHEPSVAVRLFDGWSGYLFRLDDDTFVGKGADDPIGLVTLPIAVDLVVEVGGALDGRVFRCVTADFFERPYFNHVSWSLADAMHCTLELVRAGWFRIEHHNSAMYANPPVDVDEAHRSLAPILQRWGCSPALASLPTSYWRTPEPPAHWSPATSVE